MRLKKGQRTALIAWIAEGLETTEINQRAAKYKPRFTVSRAQVDFYRKSRKVNLIEIKNTSESDALKSGLALKEKRVEVLQRLGNKLVSEIVDGDKLWLLQVKGIGSQENYERIEYYDFNKAEIDSLRGVLDDIALEVGERIRRSDITSGDEPIQIPPEQIAQRVTQLLELAKKRKENAGH